MNKSRGLVIFSDYNASNVNLYLHFRLFVDFVRRLLYNDFTMKMINSFEKSRRAQMSLLEHYEYGKIPPEPKHLNVTKERIDRTFAAGKANLVYASLKCSFEDGETYAIPITAAIPTRGKRHPAFLHIKNSPGVPDPHQPTEELCDGGFAVFTLSEEAIFGKDSSHRRGLARRLSGGRRRPDSPGRAAMLAWCAMHLMDAIRAEFFVVDADRVAVVGHGVCAISALLAGAFDERLSHVISSSSGFGCAASVLYEHGKLYERKCQHPHLFCDRFYKLSGREDTIPFDQDALLSLIAPRPLFIDNADDVLSHAPAGELASAYRASKAYENLGKIGLFFEKGGNPCEVFDENEPLYLSSGDIVYRKRAGLPYLAREDWAEYMRFVLTKGCV